MTPFRTLVFYLPPTPLGLLPGRWAVEHHCTVCRAQVAIEDLIPHAQAHMVVPEVFVQPFRTNPYTGSGVSVHPEEAGIALT